MPWKKVNAMEERARFIMEFFASGPFLLCPISACFNVIEEKINTKAQPSLNANLHFLRFKK
jgi:hypothetical protein